MVPHARFLELLQDIEPSATTKANASSAHRALRDHLWADSGFKQLMVTDFLQGSHKRDTAIRPQKDDGVLTRPDVDTIVVANHRLTDGTSSDTENHLSRRARRRWMPGQSPCSII